MSLKKIMVCLDGSKNSTKGLQTAIKLTKQLNAKILGIHSETKFGAFTAVHTPKIPEKKWSKDSKKIINDAKKLVEKNNIDFEGVVLAGHTAGYDLTAFANNPANQIDQIV
ncbi:MAG: universal stress protein [Nitrosopumilus sp.]|nr:universal stress protein [Nitrosopumilus sp.]